LNVSGKSGKRSKSKGSKRGEYSSKKGGNDEWYNDGYDVDHKKEGHQDSFWVVSAKHTKKNSNEWVSKAKNAKKRLRTAVTVANGELI
jgi:hypothetical protein